MDKSSPYISFIIPAFNEEDLISKVIKSIRDGGMPYLYEIIVVDHNSIDSTSTIAKSMSAKVIKKIGGSIASVRNLGVRHSKGEILVFLDSDVTLSREWFDNIEKTFEDLKNNPFMVTGSHCSAPENGNWIERYWFQNYIEEKNVTNIGTGHMIVTRGFFAKVGGFDESLITGEDYDFCMRVVLHEGCIVNNPCLRVIHHDFPKNLIGFILREAWHGKGDVSSLKSIFRSKVAVAALIFLMLHFIGITMAFFFNALPLYVVLLPLMGLLGLLVFSSFYKYTHCGFQIIIVNAVIFYFYYLGRTLSFLPHDLFSRNVSQT